MSEVSLRPPYADVADKEPTWRHKAFTDWLGEVTGYEVDEKTVQLSMSLVNEWRTTEAAKEAKTAYERDRDRKAQESRRRHAESLRERAARLRDEAEAAFRKAAELLPDSEAGVSEPEAAPVETAKAKRPAPAKREAPAKRAAPAKKAAPAKRAAPAKKAAPAKLAAVPDVEEDDEF
jgi:hypothetical protein